MAPSSSHGPVGEPLCWDVEERGSPHLHKLWGEGAAELRLCPLLSLFLPQASSGKGRCATNLSPLRMGLEDPQ